MYCFCSSDRTIFGGEPAVTRIGNVIFFGAADAIGRFGTYRDYALAEFWKDLFIRENLHSGVRFHNVYVNRKDGQQFTSCDLYENTEKKLLFIHNFGTEHYQASVEWDLPENMRVVQAIADGKSFDFENGRCPYSSISSLFWRNKTFKTPLRQHKRLR